MNGGQGMKPLLKKLEMAYWNTYIHILDESKVIRTLILQGKHLWRDRRVVWKTVLLAAAGFPVGYIIGVLK
jgi:hypothetical protein